MITVINNILSTDEVNGVYNFLNAEEAVKYGLVDIIIDKRDIKDVK